MNFALAALTAFLTLGCSSNDTMPKVVTDMLGVPPSGRYVSDMGKDFKVSTTGPNALSLYGTRDGQCVRFWQEKAPVAPDLAELERKTGAVRLRGQACDNKRFNDLDWRASYSTKNTGLILVYPPGSLGDRGGKPFELQYAGKEQ